MKATIAWSDRSKAVIDDDFGLGDLHLVESYDRGLPDASQPGVTLHFTDDASILALADTLNILYRVRTDNRLLARSDAS